MLFLLSLGLGTLLIGLAFLIILLEEISHTLTLQLKEIRIIESFLYKKSMEKIKNDN